MEKSVEQCIDWHFWKIRSKGLDESKNDCSFIKAASAEVTFSLVMPSQDTGYVWVLSTRHSSWTWTSPSTSQQNFPYHSVPCCFPAAGCAGRAQELSNKAPPPLGLLSDTTYQFHPPVFVKCFNKTKEMMRRGRGWNTKFYLKSVCVKCEGTHCPVILCERLIKIIWFTVCTSMV